jgi:uncharacterized membrane protein YccF (DUF307 family)
VAAVRMRACVAYPGREGECNRRKHEKRGQAHGEDDRAVTSLCLATETRLRCPRMRTVLNIIWLILSGIWLAIGYAIAGVIMFILIITIPFGIQAFKLAGYSLWPFGRTVVKKPTAGAGSVIGNLLWLVLAGWWLAIAHLLTAVFLAITIIGIPLAIGNVKLVPIALWPFGREIVPAEDVAAALAAHRQQQAAEQVRVSPIAPPVELPPEPRTGELPPGERRSP